MKANADAARVAGRRRDIGKCSAECSVEFFAYISAECGAANDPCGLGALISCRPAGVTRSAWVSFTVANATPSWLSMTFEAIRNRCPVNRLVKPLLTSVR